MFETLAVQRWFGLPILSLIWSTTDLWLETASFFFFPFCLQFHTFQLEFLGAIFHDHDVILTHLLWFFEIQRYFSRNTNLVLFWKISCWSSLFGICFLIWEHFVVDLLVFTAEDFQVVESRGLLVERGNELRVLGLWLSMPQWLAWQGWAGWRIFEFSLLLPFIILLNLSPWSVVSNRGYSLLVLGRNFHFFALAKSPTIQLILRLLKILTLKRRCFRQLQICCGLYFILQKLVAFTILQAFLGLLIQLQQSIQFQPDAITLLRLVCSIDIEQKPTFKIRLFWPRRRHFALIQVCFIVIIILHFVIILLDCFWYYIQSFWLRIVVGAVALLELEDYFTFDVFRGYELGDDTCDDEVLLVLGEESLVLDFVIMVILSHMAESFMVLHEKLSLFLVWEVRVQ